MRFRNFDFPAAALAACLLATFATPCSAATLVRGWATSAAPVVRVESNNARVRVRVTSADSVGLSLKHVVKASGWRYEAYEPRVAIEAHGDTVLVSALTGGGQVVIGAASERFEIELRVPAHSSVDLRTGDGSVEAGALDGHLRIETGDGHVRLRGTRGGVQVRTRAGALSAASVACDLSATSASGSMDVAGRFARLSLVCRSGSMRVRIEPGCRPAESWDLGTESGALALDLPGDLAMVLDARTSSGVLRADGPVPAGALHGEQSLQAVMAHGTAALRAHSESGRLGVHFGR